VKRVLLVGLSVMLFGAVLLWALPEILRRVALDQIPRRLGRAVAIEDVDLNVFARRLRVTNVRLAERRGDRSFVEVERVEARVAPTALFRSHVHLTELVLVRPVGRLARTERGELNVSDLVELATDTLAARSGRPPGRWSVTVDRLRIAGGSIRARDETLAPPVEWEVRDLEVEAGPLTTRADAAPGRGVAHARIDEATLDVTGERLRLTPLAAALTVVVDGFELRRLGAYLAQAGTPYRLTGGRVHAALTATIDHEGEELTRAMLSGTVRITDEAVARTEQDDPFLEVPRVEVTVKEADAITRSLTLSADVERLGLRAGRDPGGVIDLADMLALNARAPISAPVGLAPPPVPRRLLPVLRALAEGFERIRVEQATLGPSTLTLVDRATTPTTTLALTRVQASVRDLTWPAEGPAALAFWGMLPGGGTLHVTGSVVPQPFEADLAFRMRDAPVQPYQAYIPVPARLRGRFNGDSRQRVAHRNGALTVASRGTGWAENVEVRAPGARHPAIRIERMDLVGIDVDWPSRARVARAGFRRPRVEVVREADGSFDLQRLFTVPGAPPAPGHAGARARPPGSRGGQRKGLLETMRLDVEEIRVEDGFARFLDRTTQPAFSKDLSRLTVAVDDLSNHPGERARLEAKSIVTGDSTLDVRGELGPIGSPPFIDLVGELGSLPLASLNPYAEPAIGWVITQGDLEYKLRFRLDGDTLDASNDLVLEQLRVAPTSGTDEVKRRIGLPLNLIVALAKDRQGEIHASLPVAGSIRDPQFDFRQTVWAAIRQAVGNLVRSPLRAVGRVLRDGDRLDEPVVDPVTFAAGSSVIAPDMEKHLLRVADVLRRSPFVNLALAPALAPADVEALKAHAVAARVRAFQDERGWPDGPGLLVAYFTARFPGEEPPGTVEAQRALLRAREPAPDALIAELGRRRVDVTRERLVAVEGVPAGRLREGEPKTDAAPLPADAAGRVELTVVAGDE
jgi:hypothetical protein